MSDARPEVGVGQVAAATEHSLAAAEGADVRKRDVATPRAVIRPVRRDTVFRRLLAVADMLAAVGGLLVLGMFTRRGVPPVTFAAVPLIVVMAKVAGPL